MDNIVILRPSQNFRQVIAKYGYSVIGKDTAKTIASFRDGRKWAIDRMNGVKPDGTPSIFRNRFGWWKYLLDAPFKVGDGCCYAMKESPLKKFQRESRLLPFVGTLASESQRRTDAWLKNGCNSFKGAKARSAPLSFWKEQDILRYVHENQIPIAKVYGKIEETKKGYKTTGAERTGCMFCLFGCHLEKEPNRIQKMRQTHPKLYEYCLRDWEDGGLGLRKVMEYVGIPYEPKKENSNGEIITDTRETHHG
jgi:hypothetical protein